MFFFCPFFAFIFPFITMVRCHCSDPFRLQYISDLPPQSPIGNGQWTAAPLPPKPSGSYASSHLNHHHHHHHHHYDEVKLSKSCSFDCRSAIERCTGGCMTTGRRKRKDFVTHATGSLPSIFRSRSKSNQYAQANDDCFIGHRYLDNSNCDIHCTSSNSLHGKPAFIDFFFTCPPPLPSPMPSRAHVSYDT